MVSRNIQKKKICSRPSKLVAPAQHKVLNAIKRSNVLQGLIPESGLGDCQNKHNESIYCAVSSLLGLEATSAENRISQSIS
jgi:hypothetical protein